jgi:hypothetical protein
MFLKIFLSKNWHLLGSYEKINGVSKDPICLYITYMIRTEVHGRDGHAFITLARR